MEVKGTVKMFGAWETKSSGTVYQAATDGFVTAWKNAHDGEQPGGYTGNSSTLDLDDIKVSASFQGNNDDDGITMPVRKGDYWKVTGFQYVYWVPLGS